MTTNNTTNGVKTMVKVTRKLEGRPIDFSSQMVRLGDTVKYKLPADEAEGKARFIVTEVNGDRGFMRLVCDMAIPPVTLFRVEEVETVSETLACPKCGKPGCVSDTDHEYVEYSCEDCQLTFNINTEGV